MHINDGRVVSNFISRALSSKPFQIYGTGNQTRSFQYVTDLVNGLILLMESNVTSPVNLGNPEEFSVQELSSLISDLIPVSSKDQTVYLPHVQDDPQRRKPDITKARTLLQWEPHVKLRDGLKRTVR